jgi:hypothetical protein
MTLTEFLLARIAEDESAAERVWLLIQDDSSGGPTARFRSLNERVLAECKAKRAILEGFGFVMNRDLTLCKKHLAAVYANHPDYQPEWAA